MKLDQMDKMNENGCCVDEMDEMGEAEVNETDETV